MYVYVWVCVCVFVAFHSVSKFQMKREKTTRMKNCNKKKFVDPKIVHIICVQRREWGWKMASSTTGTLHLYAHWTVFDVAIVLKAVMIHKFYLNITRTYTYTSWRKAEKGAKTGKKRHKKQCVLRFFLRAHQSENMHDLLYVYDGVYSLWIKFFLAGWLIVGCLYFYWLAKTLFRALHQSVCPMFACFCVWVAEMYYFPFRTDTRNVWCTIQWL